MKKGQLHFNFCDDPLIRSPIGLLLFFTSVIFLFGLYIYYDTSRMDNFLIAYVTFLLALIGYWQLNKFNRNNTLQLLFHLEQEWYGESIRKRRKRCADLLYEYIDNNVDFLNKSDDDPQWTKSKVIVEDVIDFFEKLAHFTRQGDFPFDTVYDMYSYYVQGYWELSSKTRYVEKVRQQPDGENFFKDFQWLYDELLRKNKDLKSYEIEDIKRFCQEEKALTDSA